MNRDCDFEAVADDYYQHVYGDAWMDVKDYLKKVSNVFDFSFMSGESSVDPARGKHYNPARAELLAAVPELAAEGRAIALKHMTMPTRPQAVSMRLLLRHTEYIEGVAAFMREKALGHDHIALEMARAFYKSFGKHEIEIERYFDHDMACKSLDRLVAAPQKYVLQEGM